MISSHLLILQVVVPLMAAPVCLLLRHGYLSWLTVFIVNWTVLAIAILLLGQVMEQGSLSYAIGGWAAPWGIEYKLDALSVFMLLFITSVSAVVTTYARVSIAREIEPERHYLLYTVYLLFLTGLLGVVVTGDAFNMFVFIEISSLASYALISLGKDRRALMAAFQYLILGTIGATFILIGIGLLYMLTGTLNIADLTERVTVLEHNRTMVAALAFVTVGAALKLALFPLHFWLPNAYTYAPAAISALLAGTATKVFVYVLIRFALTVFGVDFSLETMRLGQLLMPLALAGVLVGSTVAIFQRDVKRLLAYSSVAQIGYMVLGISLASVTGLTAGIVHLFNHAVIKAALFLAVGCMVFRIGSSSIDDMQGLATRMPWTMAAFVVGGLSLIGVPLTAGFISKWYLVAAALERDMWPVALIVLFSSLLAVIYIWRIVEVAYFRTAPMATEGVNPTASLEAPLSMLISTWVLVLANLYFGLNTSWTAGLARQAAESLLGRAG